MDPYSYGRLVERPLLRVRYLVPCLYSHGPTYSWHYIVMAYIVMALFSYGLHGYGRYMVMVDTFKEPKGIRPYTVMALYSYGPL